jgi:hypothetical protein
MFSVTLQNLKLKLNLYMENEKQKRQILLRGGFDQLKYLEGHLNTNLA